MKNTTEDIHLRLLAELEAFESQPDATTVEALKDWKQRAMASLSPGYSARLGRLTLYELAEEPVSDDDLPF